VPLRLPRRRRRRRARSIWMLCCSGAGRNSRSTGNWRSEGPLR
jgi:hypothetical protein